MDSAGGLLVLDGIIRPGVCVLGTDVVELLDTISSTSVLVLSRFWWTLLVDY